MSFERPETTIPLKDPTAYRPTAFADQDEQNAYDDRQRRMLNYQVTDYVQDNDLICFGLSSHEIEEWLPSWTPKAQKDIDILSSWFPKSKANDILVRPVNKSNHDYTAYTTRAQVRCTLALLAIRELPIKSFYTRGIIAYIYCMTFMAKGTGRGFQYQRPIVFHGHYFHMKALLNYPDMFWWNLCRVMPKNPPIPDAHAEWRTRQTPVYHQYHKTCYRYRMRKPRHIQWDGSQSQPVMPYLHEAGTDVTQGTFFMNCSSVPGLR